MRSVQNISSASALVSDLPLDPWRGRQRQSRLQAEVQVGGVFIHGLREGQVALEVPRYQE